MGNVLRLLKRDVLRLFKAPAALLVVCFLIVLPSLYTWFNVAGFWNPYENTGNMRVCVVNEDEGAYTELTGSLDLGAQIVEQLESNDQLGWVFTDRDTAMEEVSSGKAYAAFIIPSDFSEDITTLLTGDIQRPTLQYYVNEKAGAVSPKITDAGANTLDETINSTFVSTVSGIIAERLDEVLNESGAEIDASKTSVAQQISRVMQTVEGARTAVSDLSSASDDAAAKVGEAQSALQNSKSVLANLSDQLQEASELLTETQQALIPLASSLGTTLDSASALVSQTASKTNAAVANANGAIAQAKPRVDEALGQAQTAITQNNEIIAQLQAMLDDATLSEEQRSAIQAAVDSLQAQNDSLQTAVDGLSATSNDLAAAADSIANASTEVNDAVQGTISATDGYRTTLQTQTFPALSEGTTKLSNALAQLSTAVSNQTLLVDQAISAMDQMVSALQQASGALGQTDGLLASFEADLDIVLTDILALDFSTALEDLIGEDGLDSQKIADFMASPSELETEVVYPVNAYGSAMAPLFMNMSLWIGVFMLLVILRKEADSEGIADLTAQQAYIGRILLLAPLAALQAVVCCTGNLVLGVVPASTPLFYLTAILISLTYLCIQFALAVLLQHIGMGLCIILIFVQISGATGLYPIEMTTDFFRTVYPVFPFTYGINALRETIGGFYGNAWAGYMGVLLVFLVVFLLGGVKLRPYLVNVNRMFAKQIRESGILNGEEVELPARRYRMEQMMRLLADRKEFRDLIGERVGKIMKWYPRIKYRLPFIGVAALVVVTAVLSLFGLDKVIILTVWLAFLVLLIGSLIISEYIRDRMEHELLLNRLTDEEVRELFQTRKEGEVAGADVGAAGAAAGGASGSVEDAASATTAPFPVVVGMPGAFGDAAEPEASAEASASGPEMPVLDPDAPAFGDAPKPEAAALAPELPALDPDALRSVFDPEVLAADSAGAGDEDVLEHAKHAASAHVASAHAASAQAVSADSTCAATSSMGAADSQSVGSDVADLKGGDR